MPLRTQSRDVIKKYGNKVHFSSRDLLRLAEERRPNFDHWL